MMSAIYKAQWVAMIKDTILKELRSKTLIFIFIITTIVILLANSLLKFLVNSTEGGVAVSGANSLSLMFTFINAWSVMVAGIFGISSIRSDFKDNIICQYLAFPISRTKYMLGRVFGATLLVFSYYLYSYIFAAILFSIATHTWLLHWNHLISMILMVVYIFLVILISFIYSMLIGKIESFLLLMATVVSISIASNHMRSIEFFDYLKDISFLKILGILIYWFFPRLSYISELSSQILLEETIKLNLGLEFIHLLFSSLILIWLAIKLVKKKNF